MSDTVTIHILLAVDESEATRRAVAYVGRLLAGRTDVHVLIAHVLPPFPPGRAHLRGVGWAAEKIENERQHWQREAEQAAQPLLASIRAVLMRSALDDDRVDSRCFEVLPGSELAETILAAAVAGECDTIVVGRESFSHFREFLRGHVADELVRKTRGRTLWIVE